MSEVQWVVVIANNGEVREVRGFESDIEAKAWAYDHHSSGARAMPVVQAQKIGDYRDEPVRYEQQWER